MRLAVRIAAAALCVAALILLAVPLGRRSALPPPMVVHGRATLQVRSEAPVEVGAQKVPIEVPRGAPLGGYAGRRRAESEGRVYARALVLRSGEVRAVIVALDALLVSSDLEEEVLRRTQLPPRTCLLLAATHTHSGPGGTWDNALAELAGNGRFDRGMRDAVAQAVADAIRGALGYLRTGRFAIAQVEWGDGPAVVPCCPPPRMSRPATGRAPRRARSSKTPKPPRWCCREPAATRPGPGRACPRTERAPRRRSETGSRAGRWICSRLPHGPAALRSAARPPCTRCRRRRPAPAFPGRCGGRRATSSLSGRSLSR
ncbi:MAG: hypothetical protein E6J64_04770 [Deltaproteobacteria bacterium]|nr:MAG: hypothetical protein E6J64_04770 [Deltaproteobacteria bacterium]